ncbi:MAG: peptidylprolyl isomerase [Acidobacteriota bacterium]
MRHKLSIVFGASCVLFAVGFSASAQKSVAADAGNGKVATFNTISREEVEMLLADVAKDNPMVLKRFAEDPEMKKQQLDSLRQLLAFASDAIKEGLADEPTNKQELENIRAEVEAVNYDKEINKDKGPRPPFGFITEEQTKAFWSAGGSGSESDFEKFLAAKITLLKLNEPAVRDREVTDEEKSQAHDFFAKIGIYAKEYNAKAAAGLLPLPFRKKVALQVKLQQAQFLARVYADILAKKTGVSDAEIASYIGHHPEFDSSQKRAKAEGILKRAQGGEDFAKLANEFSDDPGNSASDGVLNGGKYADVPKGRMIPAFEKAALALEPGQIAAGLVETDYGYHIIKLEKKSDVKGDDGKLTKKYDVRHILISTGYKDENGREVPVQTYVRTKLEAEKEQKIIAEIVASNHITVPDDFTVPTAAAAPVKKPVRKAPVRKKRPVRKRV